MDARDPLDEAAENMAAAGAPIWTTCTMCGIETIGTGLRRCSTCGALVLEDRPSIDNMVLVGDAVLDWAGCDIPHRHARRPT